MPAVHSVTCCSESFIKSLVQNVYDVPYRGLEQLSGSVGFAFSLDVASWVRSSSENFFFPVMGIFFSSR